MATARPSASTPKQGGGSTNGGPIGNGHEHDYHGGKSASGSDKLADLVKTMDMDLGDQHDLNAYCEAGRKLAHALAVITSLAAGELEAGAKEMAKNRRGAGWGATYKIKKVTKHLKNAADHFGSAGAGFVSTWATFEETFAEQLEAAEQKTQTHKRFNIQ
jgi:hypothetical protein